ncbi:MAG: HAMP domain-containing sensor histidine kinase [Peptococcaceae bacterium]|nr:HAMP domain-containing sensor histidine kinase [Peptococcaceae bacterium]
MAAALIIGVLVLIIAVLAVKIILLRSAADAIAQQFDDRLRADTNTPITLSCRDAHMRQLASAINDALRELRRQRLRYENGDRALKTAVTNISHDLRTPLTAIRGTLDLLEREDASPNTRRHLAIIANRTDAMTQLCEELFRYSVILADDPQHPPSVVCLNDALAESLAGFYGAFQQRSLTPDIRLCDEAVWRTLDPHALARVFNNILNNALKYSDGDLFVSLSSDAVITFANHAAALDSVTTAQLFDRFFTVETAHHATSLGLSIARTLVEQMGGRISASHDNGLLTIRLQL